MVDCTEVAVPQDDDPAPSSTGSPGNVYLMSYAFNQDYSCFVCGTTKGFRVYLTSPLLEVHRRENCAAFQHRSVVLVAMLFRTNLFAMVTMSDEDPSSGGLNKVQIWDDQRGKFVGELRSRNEVKGVVLRRDVIAMVCEYAIYVYTCEKLRVILHLTTNANSRGLCVMAAASEPWILCCPGQSTGAVRVQVGQDDRATHVFTAHQTALAALAVNPTGTLVATASEKGTVVKVFQTCPDGQLLYRLRRSARPAAISCLAFRSDDRFLAVGSSTPTVHIFKLDQAMAMESEAAGAASASPALGPSEDPPYPDAVDLTANTPIEQFASQIQKAVTKVASRAAPTYFKDLWSFATFRLPDVDAGGQPTVDARSKEARVLGPQLAFHPTEPRLSVLQYSGMIYECSFRLDHDVKTCGTQECSFVSATTWFAVRPDFKPPAPVTQVTTVAGGAGEDDEDAEAWQLL